MYVCGCRAVTDTQVHQALEAGARTAADVARQCGAGSRCGNCIDLVRAVIESRQLHSVSAVPLPVLARAS